MLFFNILIKNSNFKEKLYTKENKEDIVDFLKDIDLNLKFDDVLSGNISEEHKIQIAKKNYLIKELLDSENIDEYIDNCTDEALISLINELKFEEDERIKNEIDRTRVYVKKWYANDKTALRTVVQTLTNILLLIDNITTINLENYNVAGIGEVTIENNLKNTIKEEEEMYFNLLKTTLNNDLKELLSYLVIFDDTLINNQKLIDFLN